MSAFEQVSLIGNITYIGEIRKTHAGRSIVNIGIILGFDKRNEDGSYEQDGAGKYTESVTLFGAMADHAVESFEKGDQIIVIGDRKPKPDYTDKNGVEHTGETQITANAIGPNILLRSWTTERKKGTTAKKPVTKETPVKKEAPKPVAAIDEDEDW